ncbi:twin-arginine translocase TatA/TatE family subunit [Actinotalea sp. M2MS4P-6]|uniref:twin-arginine translocase TatA/TatE family subunit n=1 Tax=Actinotalea sp. M2MS4P-6 TaxID=2983762 RepID=UPI0021E429CE|nr:twin-arginine translocase TatA/TatE family subunit [Actinotalea sp. M2MS4P-6]MCV2394614.1 twin-arginine translocase TatA/TatE family subunit [Actinotalea sp. M2MS4P-6]
MTSAGRKGDMLANLRGYEWLVILLIVLILFGASRLPGLARSMGKSARIFKDEVTGKGSADDGDDSDDGEQPKA